MGCICDKWGMKWFLVWDKHPVSYSPMQSLPFSDWEYVFLSATNIVLRYTEISLCFITWLLLQCYVILLVHILIIIFLNVYIYPINITVIKVMLRVKNITKITYIREWQKYFVGSYQAFLVSNVLSEHY